MWKRSPGEEYPVPADCRIFSRAAQMSPGGASIIALRSTAGRQSLSTIVPKLDHKTLDGSYVDWVVTEHGAARLKGKSVAERKAAMLAIHASGPQELAKRTRRLAARCNWSSATVRLMRINRVGLVAKYIAWHNRDTLIQQVARKCSTILAGP